MKKALKAFAPGDKMYNIQRIHSKLIHLSNNKEAVNDFFSDGIFSIDLVLIALEKSVKCFIYDSNKNVNSSRKLNNYLKSIHQTQFHLMRSRSGEWNACHVCFCFMAGRFALLHRSTRRKIQKLCEFEYQEICVPMYKLDKQFIKRIEVNN